MSIAAQKTDDRQARAAAALVRAGQQADAEGHHALFEGKRRAIAEARVESRGVVIVQILLERAAEL